ncbi:MAG: GNAT family N-acetyltransferase [Polyangiaceae bacterium]
MTIIVARTARQILRHFELGDAPGIFALNGDPEVVRYTGDGPFASVEAALAFLEAYDPYSKEGMGRWACIDAATNEYLGWCGLRVQPDGEIDLGYRYKRSAWGKGLCTEAAHATLAVGFGQLGLKTIVARAANENAASIAVMRKVGMRYEGPSMCAEHPGVLYRLDASDYAGAPK